MNKILSDGTIAIPGLKVRVIKGGGGYKKGTETEITQTDGIVTNCAGHEIDLNKWKHIVKCGNLLQHVNSVKQITN